MLIITMIMGSIYFMLLDELMMGSAQSSMGPFNLGWIGILSSMINGCNLIMTQLMMPKLHFYFGFQSFPMFFFLLSMISYSIMYPFYLMNLMFSLVLMIMISGLSMLFIILSAFSGNSKYSMLGCIRMMSQLMSFELMWTTMLSYFINSLNSMSIAGLLMDANLPSVIIWIHLWYFMYFDPFTVVISLLYLLFLSIFHIYFWY